MITGQHHFANAEALAKSLAIAVAASLRQALAATSRATLAVSGGTTPQKFFAALSTQKLDWARVTITLVDERQVPETSDRSNARLVKAALIQNEAAIARFVPLYENPAAASLPDFDVVILGMGNDGHTASFFPGGDTLAEAFSPAASSVLAISAPGSGEPRLTFSLHKLLAAKEIILHIQGADKAATLQQVLAGADAMQMPVRNILQSGHEVEIYWCP